MEKVKLQSNMKDPILTQLLEYYQIPLNVRSNSKGWIKCIEGFRLVHEESTISSRLLNNQDLKEFLAVNHPSDTTELQRKTIIKTLAALIKAPLIKAPIASPPKSANKRHAQTGNANAQKLVKVRANIF